MRLSALLCLLLVLSACSSGLSMEEARAQQEAIARDRGTRVLTPADIATRDSLVAAGVDPSRPGASEAGRAEELRLLRKIEDNTSLTAIATSFVAVVTAVGLVLLLVGSSD